MSFTLTTPLVRTQIDLRAIELRRRDLLNFRNHPEIQRFRAEARNGTMPPASLASIQMLSMPNIEPLEPSGLASRSFIPCALTGTPQRAWSLGTVGFCDLDTHAAYGERLAAVDHELYITERGDIGSLTLQLEYEGRVVVTPDGFWPVKALIPFDVSQLCDCSLDTIMERVQKLTDAS